MIVLQQWGIRMGHCAEKVDDPNPRERPETTYTTDFSALKEELRAVSQGKRADVIDDDDEPFGI